MENKIFAEGNFATALGCLCAGATVVGWYPITPSTSIVEQFEKLCRKHRRRPDGKQNAAIIQCEDEMTALGTVLGAQWMGARAFTASSGPGLSLMNEFLGYAYYSETPVVLFDVQRAGPSTGLPTNTQQADISLAAFASHGDTKQILLFPGNVHECFTMAAMAFAYSEIYQSPVIVMSDLNLGMNEFVCDPFELDPKCLERGKRIDSPQSEPYFRYVDRDKDSIGYRSLPGVDPGLAFFTRGSGHDSYGNYTENPELYSTVMERLNDKFVRAGNEILAPVFTKRLSENCLLYFGSTEEVVPELDDKLGKNIDLCKIRAFPFPTSLTQELASYKHVFVLEQNRDGQMARLIRGECPSLCNLSSLTCYNGQPLTVEAAYRKLATALSEGC